uniref:(California timema) hypothetical protein n=1 Tax=Timema californicum TaxID=61474 RepID=A0A7R9P939_TIMCA|nr:unnamed protein product [Timema californicum]
MIAVGYIMVGVQSRVTHYTLGLRGWFGIRKDFCHFLLSLCPFLQEYANIAYSLQNDDRAQARSQIANDHSGNIGTTDSKPEKIVKKTELLKPVVPVISIDMPD